MGMLAEQGMSEGGWVGVWAHLQYQSRHGFMWETFLR